MPSKNGFCVKSDCARNIAGAPTLVASPINTVRRPILVIPDTFKLPTFKIVVR